MRKIIIAGHSHATALGAPNGSSDGAAALVAIDERFEAIAAPNPRNEVYWNAIAEFAPGKDVVIAWSGNQHYAFHMLRFSPPFDIMLAGQEEDVERGAFILPVLAVRESYAYSFDTLDQIIKRLAAVNGCRIFLLGTPPPIEDDQPIREHIADKRDLAELICNNFNLDLATAEPTARGTMLRLWQLIQEMTAEQAERNGVAFLPVPQSAKTETGFLRPEFSQRVDFTHANGKYGELMREYIAATLETRPV